MLGRRIPGAAAQHGLNDKGIAFVDGAGQSTLAPGVALFAVPGRGAALRAPDGEVFDIALSDSALHEVRNALHSRDGDSPALAAFAEAGYLGGRPGWPTGLGTTGVFGDSEFGAALCAALAGFGASVQLLPELSDTAAVLSIVDKWQLGAVCAVSDGPAPQWWTGLDVLPRRGIGWQRISREGRHLLIEPVAGTPQDVGHRDVRQRRLAAAGSGHEHLSSYWDQAASYAALSGADRLDQAERAMAAGLAALDLRGWAVAGAQRDGGSLVPAALPASRRLRVLDLDTGAIHDHPVLPIPDCAL